MTTATAYYTECLYTKPQEHTLYPLPEHVYECTECRAHGYHYPGQGEIWAYRRCIWEDRVTPGNQHVWMIMDTVETQGTGTPAPVTRRPGRPQVGDRVEVRLSPELLAGVDAYAAAMGITRAEAIRSLITASLPDAIKPA